jgi:hypothetical protein
MSNLNDLFGQPPLVKGEDIERYFRLLAALEHEIKPETVLDEMLVRDLADKFWEQQRCKQSVASLIEGCYIQALADLLRPYPGPLPNLENPPLKIAQKYYGGAASRKEIEEIERRLAQHAITAEQIRAKAMELCGGGVMLFSRMGTNCGNSLRSLRKEIGLVIKAREKRLAAADNAAGRVSNDAKEVEA